MALVLCNTIIFVVVIRVLIKHSARKVERSTKKKKALATVKTLISVVSIMFMFGLQWLFGAFAIAEASLVFQWLFVIFSTLQGFFLFIFFCVLAHDARQEWLNVVTLGRKRRSVITSHSSQDNRRKRNNIRSKNKHKLNRRVLLSDSSETSMEMSSRRAILLALPPASLPEERDTEFILSNENTSERSTICDDTGSKLPSFEVPEHIMLERKFMLRRNPVFASSPPRDRGMETDDEDEFKHFDDTSTEEYCDLTQLSELSVFTNDDIEELSQF